MSNQQSIYLPCAEYDEIHFTFVPLKRDTIPAIEYLVCFTDFNGRNPWTEKIGHVAFVNGEWLFNPQPVYDLSHEPSYIGNASSRLEAANKLVQEVCR